LLKEIARKGYEHLYNAATEEVRSFCKDYPMWRFYTNKSGMMAFRIYGLIRSEAKENPETLGKLAFKVISAAPIAYEEFLIFDREELCPVDMWNETQLKRISLDVNAYLFINPCGFAMVGTHPKDISIEEETAVNDFRKLKLRKKPEEVVDDQKK